MKITDSIVDRLRRTAAWFKEKIGPATAETPEFSRLKSEVQNSERNLTSFDFKDITDAHSLSKNIEDYVALRSAHIHLLGCLEGNLNVNLDGIDARIRAYAYSLRNIVAHHCRLLKVKVESEIEEIDKVMEKLEDELKTSKDYLTELEAEQKQHPGNFSLPMGWFYLAASVILLLADLPLSFLAIEELVPISGEYLQLTKWIVSFGITCIPFFVKIYFDKYIIFNRRLEYQRQSMSAWQQARVLLEFLVNSVILLFVVLNLLTLGYARHYFIQPPVHAGPPNMSQDSVEVSDSTSMAGKPGLDNLNLKFNHLLDAPDSGTVQFLTLLFMSILFPLLSGIMLAYGLFFIKNSGAIKKTTGLVGQLKNKLIISAKDKARKEGDIGVIDGRVTQWTENSEGSLTQLYYLNFIEAYKRGFVLYNGNSSSRYHIMYRKYLRHFAIADFAKLASLLLIIGVSLVGCTAPEKVSSDPSKLVVNSALNSAADVKVLCDFTVNTSCFETGPNHPVDKISEVVSYSRSIFYACFNAKRQHNRAIFCAVIKPDRINTLAKFDFNLPPEATNREQRKVLASMNSAYRTFSTQAKLYIHDAAKSTCLVNSIVRLYPDIKAGAAANKAIGRKVKIVLLTDRLEFCNGIKLEGRPSAKQAIALFDKNNPDVPDFKELGVEFIFIKIGCAQPNEKAAADAFWQHALTRFGYSPDEAQRMSLPLTEIPADLFPSSATDN